jgi:hypothetical protein
VRSVEVRTNRAVAGWGKNEYHVGLPAIVRALNAGSRPLRPWGVIKMPERWPRQITFTLREADHHPLRNSGTEEWVAAAGMLADRGFNVTIIRDTARADEPLGGPREDVVRVDPTASREIGARALTYDCATLNVGVSNGPMWMAIFKDAPVLMLRPTTNAAGGCYDDAFYKQHRLPRGSQLPCSPPHQRLVWEDDARDSIVRAVEEMLVVLETNQWIKSAKAQDEEMSAGEVQFFDDLRKSSRVDGGL